MLLYSLLHTHSHYSGTLVNPEILRPLVTGLLRGVYNEAHSGSVEHHYLLSVCLLMLCERSEVRSALVSTRTTLPWYKERQFGSQGVSLVDATLLCVLRAVMHVVMRLKDAYLASMYFAVLLNIAPFAESIDSYAAERLVGVTRRLATRLSCSSATRTVSGTGENGDVGTPLMEEALRVLVRAIWLCTKCTSDCAHLQYVSCIGSSNLRVAFACHPHSSSPFSLLCVRSLLIRVGSSSGVRGS